MLLGKGIFAGPGAEAQGGNQSSGFGLRGEAEEISEARACRPCERALFGEEFAGQRGIGGVQKSLLQEQPVKGGWLPWNDSAPGLCAGLSLAALGDA
jgi:hypothetical protein